VLAVYLSNLCKFFHAFQRRTQPSTARLLKEIHSTNKCFLDISEDGQAQQHVNQRFVFVSISFKCGRHYDLLKHLIDFE